MPFSVINEAGQKVVIRRREANAEDLAAYLLSHQSTAIEERQTRQSIGSAARVTTCPLYAGAKFIAS